MNAGQQELLELAREHVKSDRPLSLGMAWAVLSDRDPRICPEDLFSVLTPLDERLALIERARELAA